MDAREEVKKYYGESYRSLSDDVYYLIINRQGVVIWTERCCVLARMVDSTKGIEAWEDCLWKPESNPDAWYIHMMAGDVNEAIELAMKEQPLPYVVFQRGLRDERIHKLSMSKLLKNKDKI